MGTPADTTSGLNVAVPTAMRANAAPDRTDPLGGVDGDPHPVPQAVYVSRAAEAEAEAEAETTAVEEPSAPSLSWQQQVDAHRADFGLPALTPPPLEPPPGTQQDEPAPDGARIARLTARRAAREATP